MDITTELSCNVTNMSTVIEREYEQFMHEMRLRALFELYFYVPLFFIGAASNLYVLSNLIKERSNSRVNHLIKHLTIADTFVVLITIGIEILWRQTVQWPFGEMACKLSMFFRVFGFYLSSCIIICMSIDRYYALVHPLSVLNVQSRNKYFLCASYAISALLCVPQAVVFHVDEHPLFGAKFAQCHTIGK